MIYRPYVALGVNLSSLFWLSAILAVNYAKPYPDDDSEPFHQQAEGKGQQYEPTVEYDDQTYVEHKPRTQATIRADLIRNEIIPDFFLIPPRFEAIITYYNGTRPDFGNDIKLEAVRWSPHTLTYKFPPDSLFTVVMTGLDEPSKATPTKREFLHWIVGNIPVDSILAGDQIAEYYPPMPKRNTGRHRYLFLVYKQKGTIEFKEPPLTNRNDWGRSNWSSRKFAEKYRLGEPYAVNFFYSEHTEETLIPTTPVPYRTSIYYPNTNEPV